jgi:hypothetical protein
MCFSSRAVLLLQLLRQFSAACGGNLGVPRPANSAGRYLVKPDVNTVPQKTAALMNTEQARIWKLTVVTYLKVSKYWPGETE